jgi:hypothetical protein
VGRDAAQGGLGLYLVARLSAAHGWDVHGEHKVAWCRVNYTAGQTGRATAGPRSA